MQEVGAAPSKPVAGYYGYLVGLDKRFVWDKFIPEENLPYASKVRPLLWLRRFACTR